MGERPRPSVHPTVGYAKILPPPPRRHGSVWVELCACRTPSGACRVAPEPSRVLRRAQDGAARQRIDEEAPVALARDARVEHRHDAAIGRAADEPAEALLEG